MSKLKTFIWNSGVAFGIGSLSLWIYAFINQSFSEIYTFCWVESNNFIRGFEILSALWAIFSLCVIFMDLNKYEKLLEKRKK